MAQCPAFDLIIFLRLHHVFVLHIEMFIFGKLVLDIPVVHSTKRVGL